MSVVSNSSPLIALARIQRLDLVPIILQSVLIPTAVAREIAPSIPVLPRWLEVRAPTKSAPGLTSRGRLGDGEWEAIALAIELAASAIVIDDRPARRLAEAAGLNVIGTLGLLLEAKRAGQSFDFAAPVALSQLNFLIGYDVAQDSRRPNWNADSFFGSKFGRAK